MQSNNNQIPILTNFDPRVLCLEFLSNLAIATKDAVIEVVKPPFYLVQKGIGSHNRIKFLERNHITFKFPSRKENEMVIEGIYPMKEDLN